MKRHMITALIASSVFTASQASAALIVTPISETRSIHSEGPMNAASQGDFGFWDARVSGMVTTPSGTAGSSASQRSFFQPTFLKMEGAFTGVYDGSETATANSKLRYEFNLSEATWMGLGVFDTTIGVAFGGTYVRLTGPQDMVEFGPGITGQDARLWSAGNYLFEVNMDYSYPGDPSSDTYHVALWIPTPGSLMLACAGTLIGLRRRRR
jgi:hypothetical protein